MNMNMHKLLILFFFISSPAYPASVTLTHIDGLSQIRVNGDTESGDLEKIIAIAPKDARYSVVLNGGGGDFPEAVRIMKFITEHSIPTVIEKGGECYSACALIFLAGIDNEDGAIIPNRTMHSSAKLGLHAPYMQLSKSEYTQEHVEKAYRLAVMSISDLLRLSDRMKLNNRLLSLFLDKSKSEFYYIDNVDKAVQFGIRISDIPVDIKPSRVAVLNACHNFYSWSQPSLQESPVEPSNKDHSFNLYFEKGVNHLLSYKSTLSNLKIEYQSRIFKSNTRSLQRLVIPTVDDTYSETWYYCVVDIAGDNFEVKGFFNEAGPVGKSNYERVFRRASSKQSPDVKIDDFSFSYISALPKDTPLVRAHEVLRQYQRMAR